MDQRVEGKKKGASKTLPPVQKGALTPGQEATRSSLCGGRRVDARTKVQCLTEMLLGVCVAPTVALSPVSFTQQKGHTHASFHVRGIQEGPDVILRSQAHGLLFSTLKGFKNTCFSHIQLHPRTPHSSPCFQRLCVPHRSFIRGTISERITVRSMNDLCCVFQSRQRARLCSG